MADQSIIDEMVKYGSGGMGVGIGGVGAIAGLRWFVTWLTGRLDAKQQRIDAEDHELDLKWKAYREAIETRLGKVEDDNLALRQEVELCHAEKRGLEQRLAKLEGFAAGRGEAAQLGQVESSLEAITHHIEGQRTR